MRPGRSRHKRDESIRTNLLNFRRADRESLKDTE